MTSNLSRQVLLTLTASLGLLLIGAATAWACSANAHIALSASQGVAGERVEVQGEQFTAGPVRVYWEPSGEAERTLLHETTLSGTGDNHSFEATVTVPEDAADGVHYIKAYGYEESIDDDPAGDSARAFTVETPSSEPEAPEQEPVEEPDDSEQDEAPEESTAPEEESSEEDDGPESSNAAPDEGDVPEEEAVDEPEESGPEEQENSAGEAEEQLPGAQHEPGSSGDTPGELHEPASNDAPSESAEPAAEDSPGEPSSNEGQEPASSEPQPGAAEPSSGEQPVAIDDPEPEPAQADASSENPEAAAADEASESVDATPVAGPMSDRGELRPAAMIDAADIEELGSSGTGPSALAASSDLWSGLDSAADRVPAMADASTVSDGSSDQQLLALGAGVGGIGLVLLMGAAFLLVSSRRRTVAVESDG